MQEDLSCFCCLKEDCPDHGRRGAGNLTVCASYGKLKQRRMLYCRSSKARSSEHKGTLLIGSLLTEGQALSIFRAPGRPDLRSGHRAAGEGEPQHGGPPRPVARRPRSVSALMRRSNLPVTPRRLEICITRSSETRVSAAESATLPHNPAKQHRQQADQKPQHRRDGDSKRAVRPYPPGPENTGCVATSGAHLAQSPRAGSCTRASIM
jgi:hypothetical protein